MASDNPLAGLRIPSARSIADEVMNAIGHRVIDLSHPLNRERMRDVIEHWIVLALERGLETALTAATERAVGHVFRTMRDADYQEKKREWLALARKRKQEQRAVKDAAAREARMDYSKKRIETVNVPKGSIQ